MTIIVILTLMAGNASAADSCRVSDFVNSNLFASGTLKGATTDTVGFQFDNDDGSENGTGSCPSRDEKQCPVKRSLAGGDSVITSHTKGEFTCVWYSFTDGTGMTGWVPTDKLKVTPPSHAPLAAWNGIWTDKNNRLTITGKDGGILQLEGTSQFGKDDNSHLGGFTATAKPKDNVVHAIDAYDDKADETACHITLTLLGNEIVAADNGRCGAEPVGFNGVLTRITPVL